MKKPRIIELEEYSEITEEKYKDFSEHAINSGMFYCSNRSLTSKELRDKFYRKGYPVNEIYVRYKTGEVKEFNVVEDTIKYLEENMMLDDDSYARDYTDDQKRSKHGASKIRRDLLLKGIDEVIVEKWIDYFFEPEDENEFLNDFIEDEYKILKKKDYKDYELRHRLIRKAVARGYGFEEIEKSLKNILKD